MVSNKLRQVKLKRKRNWFEEIIVISEKERKSTKEAGNNKQTICIKSNQTNLNTARNHLEKCNSTTLTNKLK